LTLCNKDRINKVLASDAEDGEVLVCSMFMLVLKIMLPLGGHVGGHVLDAVVVRTPLYEEPSAAAQSGDAAVASQREK
jgi:hypothetical protein